MKLPAVMNPWATAACLLILAVANVLSAQEHIAWVADFPAAAALASEQRRLVLLHFYDDNCEPCLRLEQNVFSRPDVAKAVAQNYIAVKVHASRNPQLAARYRVNRWPTDVFVTPTGQEVHQRVSPPRPAEYIALLNQVAQQTGISATRSWTSPISQAVLPVSAQAAVEAEQRLANSFGAATQQASATAQNALQQSQDRLNAATSRFQQAADQGRQNVQQASDAAQQGLSTARQWGQSATTAAQQYQQQAQAAQQQFRDQATQFGQQVQQQAQASRDHLTNSVAQSAQQFQQTASELRAQWQQTATSTLPDRRSAFVPQQPAQQPAFTQSTSPTTLPAATAPPQVAATPPTPQPPAATSAPPLIQSPPPAPAITASGIPLPQQNPWAVKTNAPQSASGQAPAAAVTSSPPAAVAGHQPEMVPASQAPPIGLDGFCPVTLLDTVARDPNDRSAWKKGDKQFGAIHRGRTYLFTSAAHQQKFLANPDAYAPALSGCDPVRFAERGEFLDGKRAYGLITPDRQIYLFADEASRNRFEQSPANFTPAIQQALRQPGSGNLYR